MTDKMSMQNATCDVLTKVIHRAARMENRHKEKLIKTGSHASAEKMHQFRDAKTILEEVLLKEQTGRQA